MYCSASATLLLPSYFPWKLCNLCASTLWCTLYTNSACSMFSVNFCLIPKDTFLKRWRLKDWTRAVIRLWSNMPWIFQSNGLGICLRHKSAPSFKFASVPYPIHILHRPQQLENPRHNLPKTVTQVSRFPRPCKAKTFANLQMLGSCKQFLWQTGNVQQGLPVAVNKEAAKGMCRHFLRSTRRDQKRLTAWFGQRRLTLSCDRVTVGDSPIWGGLRKDEIGAFCVSVHMGW